MRHNLYTLFLLLGSVVCFYAAAEDSYTISLFATSPPEDSVLQSLPSAIKLQSSLSPEQILSPARPTDSAIVIRCRLSDNTYGLFHGKITAKSPEQTGHGFSYPQSITFEQMVRTKIFSERTENESKDIAIIAFGADRVYTFDKDVALLKVNDRWISLADYATRSGALYVQSEPAHARIYIDGRDTERTTPSVLEGIPAGEHTIEVSVPEYLFSRKKVVVAADSMITVSFQLISSVDTAYVEGTLRLGVLQLPKPPIDAPFVVDGVEADGNQVTLNEGKHRVEWFGGNRYSSLDTVVEVFLGKVTTFAFSPRRLKGAIQLTPNPADAKIYLGEEMLGYGQQEKTLPTGEYSFTVERKNYYPQTRQITIYPDDRRQVVIALEAVPDRDGDGFLDSLDSCPDEYGLYGGCAKPPFVEALRLNARRILTNMREDPFHFSVNTFSFLVRQPTNKHFRHFISYFSDGQLYMNNLKGISVGNSYTVSMRGMIASLELGQWNSGLVYQKPDTLDIMGKSGTRYAAIYDSIADINPTIILPSTAFSAGVHFITQWFNFGYLIGYQWEDIVMYDVMNMETEKLVSVTFDNDWWFHRFLIETEFTIGEWFSPTLYTSFTFPIGKRPRTGWHLFDSGLRFRFTPSRMKKRTEKYAHRHAKGSGDHE